MTKTSKTTAATPAKRGPNSTSWKPGQTGNAAGRPRTGLAFAEQLRKRLDPDVVIDLLERHLSDDDVPIAQRLATVLPYIHAGYAKPATVTDLTINGGITPARDFSAMPLSERRELLARLRSVPALADGRPMDATTPTTTKPEQESQPAEQTNASPMRRDHDDDDQAT